ncbi:transglutaminase family protein [Pleurocapsales cyanobacterium LEGE 06147]|nr:transglutaminase family protein [Pleurocapsales cyanobacterium LEGE 06147]
MKFQLGCQLKYSLTQASTLVLNISPANNNSQKVLQENLELDPFLDYEEYVTPVLGNRYLRLNAPAGSLQVSYQGTVEVSYSYGDWSENSQSLAEIPPAKLPLETLSYLYPSRYCQSDRLIKLAQYEFGDLLPDYSRIVAICNWIYDNVTYLSGSTNQHTSAFDTATQREGVCRDFAHLGIAFCRALNIPARFVAAYACGLEPPDFHACFEAYLENRWFIFDPTRLARRSGLIRVGTGRDAADVSFATIFGPATMKQMNISVKSLEQYPTVTEAAISMD